jgi:hypothetical protein
MALSAKGPNPSRFFDQASGSNGSLWQKLSSPQKRTVAGAIAATCKIG